MKEHGRPGLAILIASKAKKSKDESEDDGALESMKAFIAAVTDEDEETALEEFKNLLELCQED